MSVQNNAGRRSCLIAFLIPICFVGLLHAQDGFGEASNAIAVTESTKINFELLLLQSTGISKDPRSIENLYSKLDKEPIEVCLKIIKLPFKANLSSIRTLLKGAASARIESFAKHGFGGSTEGFEWIHRPDLMNYALKIECKGSQKPIWMYVGLKMRDQSPNYQVESIIKLEGNFLELDESVLKEFEIVELHISYGNSKVDWNHLKVLITDRLIGETKVHRE